MGTLTFHDHLILSFFLVYAADLWAPVTKTHLILLMQSKRCKCVKYGGDWGAGGDEELIWDGKLRVILCAARRGQSSYSHSPQHSHLCCSLDKYKMGLGVKSYILLSSIHIDCLQSSHGACSAVIWLFKRSMHSHSQHHHNGNVMMTFLTRRSFCLLALSPSLWSSS